MIDCLKQLHQRLYSLFLFFLLTNFSPLLEGIIEDYSEPQEVATTEGLPSSLVNRSVCAISGEYVDSVLDIVIPGPEPLTLSRVYTSSSSNQPWSFNHYDQLILGNTVYQGKLSYLISLHQPTGSTLDYVLEKTGDEKKLKEAVFKFVKPKGLTNGASMLSGKTNIKNQTLHYFRDKEKIISRSGMGNQKVFKRTGHSTYERRAYLQASL